MRLLTNRSHALAGLILTFGLSGPCLAAPIVINIDSMPVHLDPPLLTDTNANWLALQLGDRLIDEHENGDFVSNLAKAWKVSSDFKTFEFELNLDKKFADGTPVDAEAIKASFDRAIKIGAKGRIGKYLATISTITAGPSNRIVIKLKRPLPLFLHILADPMLTVCKNKTGLIFSGNFSIVGETAKSITLKRSSDEQIFELRSLGFEDAVEQFKLKKIQIIQSYALSQSKKIESISKRTLKLEYGKVYFIAFNTESPEFKTKEQRERFITRLDGVEVKKYLESVGLQLSSSLFPPVLTMGRPEFASSLRLPEKIDLNGKKKDGFTYRILTQKSHLLSPLIVSTFSRVPFTQVDLDKKEWVKALVAGSYDLTLMGFGLTIRDWDAISIWFESGAHYNFAKLKNESVDKLLRLAREEVEPVKRLKYYSELLKLNDKEKWYVPVTNIPLSVGLAEGVEYLGSRQHLISSPFIDLNKIKLVNASQKAAE